MGFLDATSGRGISTELWQGFPCDAVLGQRNQNVGFCVHPNFASYDCFIDPDAASVIRTPDGATGYQSAAVSCGPLASTMGGALRMDINGAAEECYLQWPGTFTVAASGSYPRWLLFEVAIKVTHTEDHTDFSWFAGLAEADSAVNDFISDAGALADKDLVGWYKEDAAGGNVDFVYRKAGGSVQTAGAGLVTNPAVWQHYGFMYDPKTWAVVPWFGTGDRSTTTMQAYGAGSIVQSAVAGSNFPGGETLSPIIGIKRINAGANTLDIRLLASAQLAPRHGAA